MPAKDPEQRKAQWRSWYERNKEQRAEYSARYRKERAEEIRKQRAAHYAATVDAERERYAAWFAKNAEKKRKKDRERQAAKSLEQKRAEYSAWRAKNPERVRDTAARRRARELNAPVVERIDRSAVYERDSGRCHICEKRVPRASFTLDHLVPLARGGEHTARNLSVAHKSCNSRRGAGRLPAQLLLIGE